MSRNIDDLQPPVAVLCRAFIAECKKSGIEILITCTYRSMAEQAALYAQGRTTPGAKVTNARPGLSWHQYRTAFDFVPIVHGKCAWNDTALFNRCGAIAKSVGLEWAGDWKQMKEKAHCQLSKGLTFAEMKDGKQAS